MTRPILASSFVDHRIVVQFPVVGIVRSDADYHRQRAAEQAELFARLINPPQRSEPELVLVTNYSRG